MIDFFECGVLKYLLLFLISLQFLYFLEGMMFLLLGGRDLIGCLHFIEFGCEIHSFGSCWLLVVLFSGGFESCASFLPIAKLWYIFLWKHDLL